MDALGIEKAAAIGHLTMWWWWCLDFAKDGRMKPNPVTLSRAADWNGDANAFADALLQVGWMDRDGDMWAIHDAAEYRLHYELSLEKKDRQREQVRKRVEKYRKAKTVTQVKRNGNAHVTPCNAPTVPNITVPEPTKQTKDIAASPPKPLPVHVSFVESFTQTYEAMTGNPFKAGQKEYVMAAKLIKDFGLPTVIEKARVLGELCRDGTAWFTKDGWASYTIPKLSEKWNEILPRKPEPTKDDEFKEALTKWGKR